MDYKNRLEYALNKLQEYDIEHYLINVKTGEIHCYTKAYNTKLVFYANTGKIKDFSDYGIFDLIAYCYDMPKCIILEKELNKR